MGLLDRLRDVRFWRDRGALADGDGEPEEPARLPRPVPTAGTRIPERPRPTPTTKPLAGPGTTAGTRTYRGTGGTPSTQRIHNPLHPGG